MTRRRRGKLQRFTGVENSKRRKKQALDKTRAARVWARRHIQGK